MEDISESYPGWRMIFDGAANLKGVGIGAVLISKSGQHNGFALAFRYLEHGYNQTQWHEKLSFALLGYCTTMRTSTGAMPYMLVYGTEAIIPAEVEIPSLRIIQEAKLDDVECIRVRQEQLMLIDEKRTDEMCHGQLFQNRMDNAFNMKVKS
nr:uncharacterized protein LOC117278614 [Nicotiana tomentosiformis]